MHITSLLTQNPPPPPKIVEFMNYSILWYILYQEYINALTFISMSPLHLRWKVPNWSSILFVLALTWIFNADEKEDKITLLNMVRQCRFTNKFTQYTFLNNNTPHSEQRRTVLIRQLLHTVQWQQGTQWATPNCFNQTIVTHRSMTTRHTVSNAELF